MYEQIQEDAIFVMLYAVVTVLAALGCVYLLFRRGNAFAADVTVTQLARAQGTNRTYLGMYFSRQGTTYNSYINDLRIDCFVRLVREANAAQRPFTAQELAAQSGYRSYRTFSVAFRQRTGQSVKDWIAEQESALQSNKSNSLT